MPRRSILTATDRASLMALPEEQDDLIRSYTFNDTDLALIRQRRGDDNRLGFAVQLCLLRYPGYALEDDITVTEPVIHWIAAQIDVDPAAWTTYGARAQTRREHLNELRSYLSLSAFGLHDFRVLVHEVTELALQTDKGLVLATHALLSLRGRHIVHPSLSVIDRVCAIAITRASQHIYRTLIEPLTEDHQRHLDELLHVKPESSLTWLVWLRQSPVKPNSRSMLEHIERLKMVRSLALPEPLGRSIHQNYLVKMAREGGQMTPRNLRKFERERRYATLVALVLECTATLTDELVDLHDRILMRIFRTAKIKHDEQFQNQSKAINDKVRLYS